ncbi:MAG: TIR domain-containing protein [Oscillospiraceae bacterium]|nr:TIR domain-containing protein [Oscillospiraceae bacterium]
MHDVFISYSSYNKEVADAICHYLEDRGIKCWYAPRDVKSGESWAASIVRAIGEAKIFVLVYSAQSNQSEHVGREVSHAANRGCSIIPFRVDDAVMSDELSYYLQSVHWLDALSPPMERYIGELCDMCGMILGKEQEPAPQTDSVAQCTGRKKLHLRKKVKAKQTKGKKKRKKWIAVVAALLVLVWLVGILGSAPPEVPIIPFRNLSQTGDMKYPFYGTEMFSEDRDFYFLQDKNTVRYSYVKTDTLYPVIDDFPLSFWQPTEVAAATTKNADTIFFIDYVARRVRIYDREHETWIQRLGIPLKLSDQEVIPQYTIRYPNTQTAEDRAEEIELLIYDQQEDVNCYSKILSVTEEGTLRVWDISEYQLTEIISGSENGEKDFYLAIDRQDKIKIVDILQQAVLDMDYNTYQTEYVPYLKARNDKLSPGGRYLRTQKNISSGWETAIWDLKTGEQVRSDVFTLNFSANFCSDHEILYFNFEDDSVRICDLETGKKRLLLDAEYFANRDLFLDAPYACAYSGELNALCFSSCTYRWETGETIQNKLTITDLDGKVLAQSEALSVPFRSFSPLLEEWDGTLYYFLTADDRSAEYPDGICTMVYQADYTTDENGMILFE